MSCSAKLNTRVTAIFIINDLKDALSLLDSITFVDDTKLFLTHKDISYLFETANLQL